MSTIIVRQRLCCRGGSDRLISIEPSGLDSFVAFSRVYRTFRSTNAPDERRHHCSHRKTPGEGPNHLLREEGQQKREADFLREAFAPYLCTTGWQLRNLSHVMGKPGTRNVRSIWPTCVVYSTLHDLSPDCMDLTRAVSAAKSAAGVQPSA